MKSFVRNVTGRSVEEQEFLRELQRFRDSAGNWLQKKQTQTEALDAFIEGLGQAHTSGYFDIPTGVGKTALFLALIKNYTEATRDISPRPRMLIVVPSQKLVTQTAKEFAKFMPDAAPLVEGEIDWDNQREVGAFYERTKHFDKPVIITTYSSLLADSKKNEQERIFRPEEFKFLVFDEAHKLTGEKISKVPERFSNAIRLGFTATPDYSFSKGVGKLLPHCFYSLPLHTAIERGDICPVRPVLVKTGCKIDYSSISIRKKGEGDTNYNGLQVQAAVNIKARNIAAVSTYLRYSDPDTKRRLLGQSGTITCAGVTHAEDVAGLFNEEMNKDPALKEWCSKHSITQLAAPINGNMPQTQKDDLYKKHEAGQIPILCYDSLLREGYDCPRDSFVMNLAPTLSFVAAKQRGGRSHRLDSNDPGKISTVFDFIDHDLDQKTGDIRFFPVLYQEILGDSYVFRCPTQRTTSSDTPPKTTLPEFETITSPGKTTALSAQRSTAAQRLEKARQGWVSPTSLYNQEIFLGSAPVLQRAFKEYREGLIREGRGIGEIEELICEVFIPTGDGTTLYASPQAIADMQARGLLKKMEAPVAVAKPEWMSANAIYKSGQYCEDVKTIQRAIAKFRQELLDEKTPLEVVREHWVEDCRPSTGTGFSTLHISRMGLRKIEEEGLITPKKMRAQEPPEDWVTANNLWVSRRYSANDYPVGYFAAQMQKYQRRKQEEGVARESLEKKFIQVRRLNGSETTFVSPLAIAEMEAMGLLVRRPEFPPLDPTWMSGSAMCRTKAFVGDVSALSAALDKYLEIKRLQGVPEAEIAQKWIGRRTTKHGGHTPLCASPAGIEEMQQLGLITVRIQRDYPPPDPQWLSISAIFTSKQFSGGREKLLEQVEKYKTLKLETLSADEVDKKWVGRRAAGKGSSVLFLSPTAVAEMEVLGFLKRRTPEANVQR